MLDKVSAAVPVLLTVTLCEALVLPMAVEASVSDVGDMLATGAVTDTPEPDNAMVIGVSVLLCEMLSVPVRVPAAVGVNDTITVQLRPVFTVVTVVPHVPPLGAATREKSPLVLTAKLLSTLPDPLVLALTVTVCVADVDPTLVDANVSVDGEFPR